MQQELERPRRGRPPRAEEVAGHRRRRRAGTLNRMAQFKLDCIAPEDLDLANYVYYWINDETGNVRRATQDDDYDFVTEDEIGRNFDPADADSESAGRVRMLVGNQKSGAPLYSYLCKKRRSFWEADVEEMVRAREDLMAGRVYRGVSTEDEEAEDPTRYVPAGNQIGSPGRRRSGPIPRTLK